MNSIFSPFFFSYMDDFLFSYIAFLDLVSFFFFF